MAPRKTKAPRRKIARRKPVRRQKATARVNTNNPNNASCVELINDVVLSHNTPYIFSKAGITGVRASSFATNFAFYRIAKITYVHRPYFDTFSPGLIAGVPAGNPITVPQLYWQMNRQGDAPATFDGDYLRSLGSKPLRFDDKNITVSYKPNMLMVAQDNAGNNASQVKLTPWLSTDERPGDGTFTLSTAEHYGHLLFIDSAASAVGQVGVMDIQIHYEFKGPRAPTQSTVDALTAPVQTLKF